MKDKKIPFKDAKLGDIFISPLDVNDIWYMKAGVPFEENEYNAVILTEGFFIKFYPDETIILKGRFKPS